MTSSISQGGEDGDPQVAELAARSSNFGHLLRHEPLLVTLGCAAESYVHTDAHTAMIKARLFGEVMTRHLVALVGLQVQGTRQVDRINALTRAGVLVPQVRAWFESVRSTGNRAARVLRQRTHRTPDRRDLFQAR